MKKIHLIIAAFFFLATFVACEKENLTPNANTKVSTNKVLEGGDLVVCGSTTYTLWAGQTINAGTLTVANDDTNLYVTYTTTGVFGTLHLWVGTDMALLPVNSQGTPIPGQFPYVFDASGLTTYMYTIPLANVPYYTACGNTIYVVAHAEVSINGNNETAFGGDTPGTGTARWFFYAAFKTVCCPVPPPPPSYEKLGTAFAKGEFVFTTDRRSNPENLQSLYLTKNRWGWATNMYISSSRTLELWAGAGLNNTAKGTLIGSVDIDYLGSRVAVTYNLFPGYAIEEAHIYAGDFKPTTIAPGQYGNTYYFSPYATSYTTTIDVSDTNGDGIWLIVHAVAYGPGIVNI